MPLPRASIAAVTSIVLTASLLLAAACGSASSNSNRRASQPKIEVAGASATQSNGRPVPQPSATAVPGSFGRATPTPLATCAPADLLRLVDRDSASALPADYVPPDLVGVMPIDASPNPAITLKLRQPAETALHRMLTDARAAGVFLLAQSTYRSYQDQARVYQSEVQNFGQPQADRESARPGHSEHQLGLAIDFTTKSLSYDLNESFAATPEGRWLTAHAAQYGFVLSYPQDKEAITGYMYEPWHYRFIDVDAAQAFVKSGLTLREWLSTRQLGCHA